MLPQHRQQQHLQQQLPQPQQQQLQQKWWENTMASQSIAGGQQSTLGAAEVLNGVLREQYEQAQHIHTQQQAWTDYQNATSSKGLAEAGGLSKPPVHFKIPSDLVTHVMCDIMEIAHKENWNQNQSAASKIIAKFIFNKYKTRISVEAHYNTISTKILHALEPHMTSLCNEGQMRDEVNDQAVTGNEAEGANAQELQRLTRVLAQARAAFNKLSLMSTKDKEKAKKQQAETQERENDYLDEAVLTFAANRGGRTDDPVDVDDDEEGEEDVLGASYDEEDDDGKKKGKRNKQKGGGSKKKPRRSSAASRNANAMAVNVHSPPPTMDMTQVKDEKFMERMVKLSYKVQQTQQLSQTPAPGAFNAAMAELRTAERNGDITTTEALQWKNRVRAEHSLPPMDK